MWISLKRLIYLTIIYIYKYDHYDILKIIHKNMSNTIEIIKGLFEN